MTKLKYALVIFLLALVLRLPNLGYPPKIVFDEVEVMTYSLHFAYAKPYFYVHPPLLNMLYGTVARIYGAQFQNKISNNDHQFGDYPFLVLRRITAVVGSVIPVLVFFVGWELGKNKLIATVLALAVATDNALVLYSRLILPDIWIPALGLTAVWLAIKGKGLWAGIFLAMAVSIKWTGAGWAVPAGLFLIYGKHFKSLAGMAVTAGMGYILIWVIFFGLLGPGKAYSGYQPMSGWLEYPQSGKVTEILKFIPVYHGYVLKANSLWKRHDAASTPVEWIMGGGKIVMFTDKDRTLVFLGNTVGWWSVLGGLILGFWLAVKNGRMKILFLGVAANLLPFFFLGRVFFLYHYFSALIIGYLILGGTFTKLKPRMVQAWLVINTISFVLISPVTYGWPVPIKWLEILAR